MQLAEISAYDVNIQGVGLFKIERCRQSDESYKWAIRMNGLCLGLDGEFDIEPLPSSRDDAFIKMYRHDSAESAYYFLQEYISKLKSHIQY